MASLPLGPQQHHHNPPPDHLHHLHHHNALDQAPHPSAAVKPPAAAAAAAPHSMDTDKEMAASVVEGNDPLTGHIISTTIGGKNGEPKRTISYMAERVVGTGSFGIVFQAKCLETGETVAIKKVLQDRRYKNRELQLMRLMDHPNVISLKHCFFSTTTRDELFLNLVMDYVPETMYKVLKHYTNSNQRMPLIYVKLYTYQLFRGLAYMHTVAGVSHRDIKPQNILVDPLTHQVKICDFGSAKVLVSQWPCFSWLYPCYIPSKSSLGFNESKLLSNVTACTCECRDAHIYLFLLPSRYKNTLTTIFVGFFSKHRTGLHLMTVWIQNILLVCLEYSESRSNKSLRITARIVI
ncbi:hypothetical protein MIMGU_mgv1a006689mg [Erythranthe guttata]|uniref:Protein kinase domain-containing protein n=1 Tax=Erythranthe guttata TaxID=4155 RepID=A0A022QT53_ERYGU|nr:hypothetical protein MIMGU_mgv1a006689mg [Erythranthe guttata]